MGPNRGVRRGPPSGLNPDRSAPGEATPGEVPPVIVRTGLPGDAADAAALHVAGIDEGFLSALGTGFLTRLYRRVSLVPDSFLLVATCDHDTVGFIAGSTEVGTLYRSFLVRDGLSATLGSWRHLLSGWRRVLETLRHGSSSGPGVGPGCELLAVAVDQGCQGRGVGHTLVTAFLDEVTARGSTAAEVVVAADNTPAIALYRSHGFVEHERFELHPGTESLLLTWAGPGHGQA